MNARLCGAALPALMLAGTLGLAVPATAQNAAPGGAGAASEHRNAGQTESAATPVPPRTGVDWVQRQLERLHRQLKITPAEEAAWNQFADTTLGNVRQIDDMYKDRAQHFEAMNAVDNLKSYQSIIQSEAEGLGKRAAALGALYDSLSPEQKQAADRFFRYQEERREQRYMARHNTQ
jgi:protein CpxP